MRIPASGVELVHSRSWAGPDGDVSAGPPPKHVHPGGHRLSQIAAAWPGVRQGEGLIGVYQALGPEKMEFAAPLYQLVHQHGFDAMKPASLVLATSPYGPATTLALEFGCTGPFLVLEGDALAGSLATLQALTDLRRGRCARALVFSCVGDRLGLMLLRRCAGDGLRWLARFLARPEGPLPGDIAAVETAMQNALEPIQIHPAADPHGFAAVQVALQRAQEGTATLLWCARGDGLGVLLAFARSPAS